MSSENAKEPAQESRMRAMGYSSAPALGLCILLIIRLFSFNAAFPFWNNIDEQAHFDAVVKYANGFIPREGNSAYGPEAVQLIVRYGSPEYLNQPSSFGLSQWPPPWWAGSAAPDQRSIAENEKKWLGRKNHEAYSPPLYYLIAGLWYNIGKRLGLEGFDLIYWVRFLNVPLAVVLFSITFVLCRQYFGDDPSLRWGVLLLLAAFPQNVFFSINSDVLSPIVATAAFYLVLRIYVVGGGYLRHAIAGATCALAPLVKLSNLSLAAPLAVMLALTFSKTYSNGTGRRELPKLLLLLISAAAPVLGWFSWNAYALHDMTGNSEKIRLLGWTMKSVSALWDHPLFTPDTSGIRTLVGGLIKTFWRGEVVWNESTMAFPGLDYFYVFSSCLFVSVSLISTIRARPVCSDGWKLLSCLGGTGLLAYGALFAALSISFDFGSCWYPSQEHPYFTSGRLALGILIPFIALYVDGLRAVLFRITPRINSVLVVSALCIILVIAEVVLTYPVFMSPYNWFYR